MIRLSNRWRRRTELFLLICAQFLIWVDSADGIKSAANVTTENGSSPLGAFDEDFFDGSNAFSHFEEPLYPLDYEEEDNVLLNEPDENRSQRVFNPANPFDIRGNPFCKHENLDGMCFGVFRCFLLGGKIGPLCRGFTGICCRFVRTCGQRSSQEIVYWSNYDNEGIQARASPRRGFADPSSMCDLRIVKRTRHYCGIRVQPFLHQAQLSQDASSEVQQQSDISCSESTKLSVLGLGRKAEVAFCPLAKSLNAKKFDYNLTDVEEVKLTMPTASSFNGRSGSKIDIKITQLKCIEFVEEDLEGSPAAPIIPIIESPTPDDPNPDGSTPDETTPDESTPDESTPDETTTSSGTDEDSKPPPPVTVDPSPPDFGKCGVKGKRDADTGDDPNDPIPTDETVEEDFLFDETVADTDTTEEPPTERNDTETEEIKWGVPTNNQSNFFYILQTRATDITNITSTRITKGLDTYPGEYPWHAAMFTSGNTYICGASIISDFHLLTAAHCVDRRKAVPSSIKFRLGAYKLSDTSGGVVQEVPAERIRVHERYSSTTFQNDIAVVRVRNRIHFTKRIRPICLPPKGFGNLAGKKATVTGWGRDENKQLKQILQKLTSIILSNSDCARRWGSIANIRDGMLCMSSEFGDSCQGDSGGPSVAEVKSGSTVTYYQIGLVSFGTGSCLDPELPGVYTRITSYIDWIRANMI